MSKAKKKSSKPTSSKPKPKGAPIRVSEDELDKRYEYKSKLESGGDYALDCLILEGDLQSKRAIWLEDDHMLELRAGHEDIGTILIDGDVRCDVIVVSDRLMNLIITGDLVAKELSIWETEVTVFGNLEVGKLYDPDEYLKVLGKSKIRKHVGYGEQ